MFILFLTQSWKKKLFTENLAKEKKFPEYKIFLSQTLKK